MVDQKIKKDLIRRAEYVGVQLVEKEGLLAPAEFWDMSAEERRERCNGCGPGRLWWLVPDNPHGVCFGPACDIHDFTHQDVRFNFSLSNALFKYNLGAQAKKSEQNVGRLGYYLAAQYVWAVRTKIGYWWFKKSRHEI